MIKPCLCVCVGGGGCAACGMTKGGGKEVKSEEGRCDRSGEVGEIEIGGGEVDVMKGRCSE